MLKVLCLFKKPFVYYIKIKIMAKAEKIYEYKKMRVENTIHHLFKEQG